MAISPTVEYPTKTTAPTGDYPYGSARNITVTGDGTGTPWEQKVLNDIFGFQQDLLSLAAIIPSGTPDKVGASQYVEALRKSAGYPGLLQWHALEADPASLGVRLLNLDGSGILRANYAALDNAVYVGDGDNAAAAAATAFFYRATLADGVTPNIAGDYLILPDVRGTSLRMLDPTNNFDIDRATDFLGFIQGHAVELHNHLLRYETDIGTFYDSDTDFGMTPGGGADFAPWGSFGAAASLADEATMGTRINGSGVSSEIDGQGTGDVSDYETRSVNSNFKLGIWY